jgi:hypothetical protein
VQGSEKGQLIPIPLVVFGQFLEAFVVEIPEVKMGALNPEEASDQ